LVAQVVIAAGACAVTNLLLRAWPGIVVTAGRVAQTVTMALDDASALGVRPAAAVNSSGLHIAQKVAGYTAEVIKGNANVSNAFRNLAHLGTLTWEQVGAKYILRFTPHPQGAGAALKSATLEVAKGKLTIQDVTAFLNRAGIRVGPQGNGGSNLQLPMTTSQMADKLRFGL
jgi:hypothetical protein